MLHRSPIWSTWTEPFFGTVRKTGDKCLPKNSTPKTCSFLKLFYYNQILEINTSDQNPVSHIYFPFGAILKTGCVLW